RVRPPRGPNGRAGRGKLAVSDSGGPDSGHLHAATSRRADLTSRSALEGERKSVTVLFCDLVGSTGLAKRLGAARMPILVNAFFEPALVEVHRYEGTVNQFLGDGFMALFGTPLAHEGHPRRPRSGSLARSAITPQRSGRPRSP